MSDVRFSPVPEFSAYRAGSDGSVWSLYRRASNGRAAMLPRVIGEHWRRLKPIRDKRNRLVVKLCRDGKVYRKFVHQVILEAFVGPCPDGMQACHFPDRDTTNNKIENLRWDTPLGNAADKVIHGTIPCGSKHWKSKLSPQDVMEIRKLSLEGMTQKAIAARFLICKSNVWWITSGKRWKNLLGASQ